MITPEGLGSFRNQRVLLLQGPIGPFFSRLAQDLRAAGAEVFKVNFNGGDLLFSPAGSPTGSMINFRGSLEEWPEFFSSLIDRLNVDCIFLFGDCRSYHRIAHHIAQQRGIDIGVYEEGYVRPDYITLERHGVNGHSSLPRDPAFYRALPEQESQDALPVGNTFWHAVWWAILYYAASALLYPVFPRYRHHRPLNIFQGLYWLRSAWRHSYFRHRERGILDALTDIHDRRFFLVPLQVHNDTQLCVHSDYTNVRSFIREVVKSFASHAPDDTVLVFKHHPLDRGYHDYSRLIKRLESRHRLTGRLLYVHDQHLPTLLNHTRGVVLINSTVGMSAIYHNAPVKVTGVAIYDMEGLTFQGGLDAFWGAAEHFSIDKGLFRKFRGYLIRHTQINGSFYKPLPDTTTRSGLAFPTAPATLPGHGMDTATVSATLQARSARKAVLPAAIGVATSPSRPGLTASSGIAHFTHHAKPKNTRRMVTGVASGEADAFPTPHPIMAEPESEQLLAGSVPVSHVADTVQAQLN